MRRALLVLALAMGASGCHLDARVVAATASIATVQTIDDGIEVYTALANGAEARIAAEVIAACKSEPRAWDACVAREKMVRRATWDKADDAIRVYRQALAAGGAALGKQWGDACTAVIRALAVVGVRIGGTP